MLGRALLAVGIAAATDDNKPPKTKPLNGGPITAILVLVVVGIVAAHHTVLTMVLAPLIITAIVLVGAIVHGVAAQPPVAKQNTEHSIARQKRVSALIITPCPTCRAPRGESCKVTDPPYAIIDAKWNTASHFTRIERSVKLGLAVRQDVIAQFGGTLPKGLNI